MYILHSLKLLSSLIDIPNFLHFEGAGKPLHNKRLPIVDASAAEKSETMYSNPLGFILDYSKWFSSPESKYLILMDIEYITETIPEESEAEQKAKEVISQCGIKEVIENTSNLDAESLVFLLKAIILASSKSVEKSDTAFYLDLLTKIVLLNEHRIGFIWY